MSFKGFGKKEESLEELEGRRDRVVVEDEIVSKEADMAERRVVISELKSKYGKSWAKTLGISKFTDLSSLKSFLVSAKQGLEKQSNRSPGKDSSPISRAFDYRGITKA